MRVADDIRRLGYDARYASVVRVSDTPAAASADAPALAFTSVCVPATGIIVAAALPAGDAAACGVLAAGALDTLDPPHAAAASHQSSGGGQDAGSCPSQRIPTSPVPCDPRPRIGVAKWLQPAGWAEGADCRHVSGRLERFLIAAGERCVRVPPKLMAATRRSARSRGKSAAIDAACVARAALREPGLPKARLEGPERELRLLADHRADLVGERTRIQQRLRWHLHELALALEIPVRALDRCPCCPAHA